MVSFSGFELWVPPQSDTYDENGLPKYEIIGSDAQIVQFPLVRKNDERFTPKRQEREDVCANEVYFETFIEHLHTMIKISLFLYLTCCNC